MSDRASRTEQPTGKKLQEARDKGNVPRTQELAGALVMLAFLIYFRLFGTGWLEQVRLLMTGSLSELLRVELTDSQWPAVVRSLMGAGAWLLFLPVGTMAVASIAGGLAQGVPPLTLQPLKPDLTRLNPVKGLGKIFRLKALVDLGKATTKALLFTVIAYLGLRKAMLHGLAGSHDAEGVLLAIIDLGGGVMLRVTMLMLALALIDLLYTRWDYIRGMRMTKQEVKEERKQLEGDPRVRSKIKSKQFEAARARMMAEVPNATVVVTNPTHYAVAIRYVPHETEVPQVLAKGRGLIAQRIREIAVEHRIPVVREPVLARALFRAVPLGGFIPEKLFRAVAEVLALVMRGRPGRAGLAGNR